MEGRAGGRKPYDVWEHVEKLGGNRVKCKHCEFQFAAASATRITSHVYSIPNQGIRGCTFGQAANGPSERVKNITRPGNLEAEMASDTNLDVLANTAREKRNKRKEIAVEVEKNKGHALRMTSIWHTTELEVADLEEKLDAFMVRVRQHKEELTDLKVKSENEKDDFRGKITTLEAKAEEEASQFMNQKFEMEGKLKEAHMEISLLTAQLSHMKEKLDASQKEKADLFAKITTLETKAEKEALQFLNLQFEMEAKDIKISSLIAQLSQVKAKSSR